MRNFYRLMLGRKSIHFESCFNGGFVGTDFDVHHNLSGRLPDNWRDFNKEFIPIYLESNPDKSKITAGLACGAIWTVSKGMGQGDIVLCPDGAGQYRIGEISGVYNYANAEILPHRRSVRWLDISIERAAMSEKLQNSCGSIGTISNVSKYSAELERLLQGLIIETIEDSNSFALEKHLEDFLVKNWNSTELGKEYIIYEEDGEPSGQQYATDTGPIDILAISKDKKTLLVIELKKGKASDSVVGQILRYMDYVVEVIADPEQTVRGIVIALDDDKKLRRALARVSSVEFYSYKVDFKLVKG
jgi:restriction system protein